MASLQDDLIAASRKISGSHKSRHDRNVHLKRFSAFLLENNINIEKVEHIRSKHIRMFIQSLIDKQLGKRTICNVMANIRSALRAANRRQLADFPELSNETLGIGGGSRKGTKEPISTDRFNEVFQLAFARDEGFAACLMLSISLGLRREEAVQSCKSLKTWKSALLLGQDRVMVIFGTKGGRPRETRIHDHDAVSAAVDFAIRVMARRGGKLIDKPDLKSAMYFFSNSARVVGLVGKYAPHSLRYRFSHDALAAYLKLGLGLHEARAMVAVDLGHGAGRGRYVSSVYRQSAPEISTLSE